MLVLIKYLEAITLNYFSLKLNYLTSSANNFIQ